MPKIHVLSPHIANQIAAGEVVERPSSIVKELVENAVDAKADAITIEIENGGIDRIRVSDNGRGILSEDCETAFLRHATSKITCANDLAHIATLGFRGEALASIAAVAHVKMATRTQEEELGDALVYEGGSLKEHKRAAGVPGTSIEVTNLFFNVPARLKFLKSARSESGAIGDYVAKAILSLPNVAFTLINNAKTVYRSAGDGSLENALVAVYGVDIVPHLCPVAFDDGYLKIDGFVGTPELSRPNRMGQSFFLNGRIIRSNALSAAVSRAFDTRLLIGRYPFAALAMQIALAEVDVNVHPSKLEVRFVEESRVTRSVCVACSEALIRSYVPEVQLHGNCMESSETATMEDPAADAFSTSHVAARLPSAVELRTGDPFAYGVRESVERTHVSAFQPATLHGTSADAMEADFVKNAQDDLFTYATAQAAPFSQPFTVIGVAFQTYWFVQQGEALYCIDQHAAHERLLFDQLSAQRTAIVSQALLMPEQLTLLPSDYALYLSRKSELEEFGYLFGELPSGETGVILAAVPQLNGQALKSAFLLDVLHEHDLTKGKLMQKACKHAIKAGEPITHAELETLLKMLADTGALLTCPHGRPVAVRLSKLDFEKMFQRVL